ncbi:hypothetical protein [Yersinia alsatica]|uniref:hypothetical protein n=1 Tax=Yersinia alsatica TaxID=2890317 RepID=UPI0011A0AFA5|nr:hypothetical protein [Yersinia alsatica]
MVTLVVLTGRVFRFSLHISQLLAKAIPVRGAILEKPAQGNLSGLFASGGFCPLAKNVKQAVILD